MRIIFGLGSNLGDREFYLTKAAEMLEQDLFLKNIKKSEILKNPALLLKNSPAEWNRDFFNIALSADINLENFSPQKILQIIKNIEKDLGRKDSKRWAPREIDIDILAIEDLVISIPDLLEVPHKGLFERDFFKKTAAEIEEELLKKIIKKVNS